MLKSFKIFLARRRIARWKRRRGVLAFLGTWLPIWCALAAVIWGPWQYGVVLFFAVPVLAFGRYFVARRRADVVVQQIYSIVRLNHPLVDGLRIAGNSDCGAVGVRLEILAELLANGTSLSESLRLAVPELRAEDRSAIAAAENSEQLLPVLACLAGRPKFWDITSELDYSMLLYCSAVFLMVLAATLADSTFIAPKLQKLMLSFRLTYSWPGFFPHGGGSESAALVGFITLCEIAAAGAILRRLAIPFFRRGNVSIYIRDAVAWRLPVLGSLIRCRSWSDGTRILAQGVSTGQPLPEISQSAATAVGSRVARRRLRLWREKMLAGMSADNAARKCGLPRMLCSALAQPLGSTGSALTLVAGYYDLKYRRKLELIRAISIPIAVLCMGTLVLLLCLALYVPYIQILQAVSGGGG